MTDTTISQYAKARRRFHEQRRDPDRLPTRTFRHIGMPPPELDGHLTLDGIADAIGLTPCAVYFRSRRGVLPFPIIKRGGNLYARVQDVAPHMTDMARNGHQIAQDAMNPEKSHPPTPDDASGRSRDSAKEAA